MTVKFTVKIQREGEMFVASSDDATGTDTIIAGYGEGPYEALHALIDELDAADLYRPD